LYKNRKTKLEKKRRKQHSLTLSIWQEGKVAFLRGFMFIYGAGLAGELG
jgi:hypothetical protein